MKLKIGILLGVLALTNLGIAKELESLSQLDQLRDSLASLIASKTPEEAFGITPGVSAEEIQSKLRALAKNFAPVTSEEISQTETPGTTGYLKNLIMKEINRANAALKDKTRYAEWMELAAERHETLKGSSLDHASALKQRKTELRMYWANRMSRGQTWDKALSGLDTRNPNATTIEKAAFQEFSKSVRSNSFYTSTNKDTDYLRFFADLTQKKSYTAAVEVLLATLSETQNPDIAIEASHHLIMTTSRVLVDQGGSSWEKLKFDFATEKLRERFSKDPRFATKSAMIRAILQNHVHQKETPRATTLSTLSMLVQDLIESPEPEAGASAKWILQQFKWKDGTTAPPEWKALKSKLNGHIDLLENASFGVGGTPVTPDTPPKPSSGYDATEQLFGKIHDRWLKYLKEGIPHTRAVEVALGSVERQRNVPGLVSGSDAVGAQNRFKAYLRDDPYFSGEVSLARLQGVYKDLRKKVGTDNLATIYPQLETYFIATYPSIAKDADFAALTHLHLREVGRYEAASSANKAVDKFLDYGGMTYARLKGTPPIKRSEFAKAFVTQVLLKDADPSPSSVFGWKALIRFFAEKAPNDESLAFLEWAKSVQPPQSKDPFVATNWKTANEMAASSHQTMSADLSERRAERKRQNNASEIARLKAWFDLSYPSEEVLNTETQSLLPELRQYLDGQISGSRLTPEAAIEAYLNKDMGRPKDAFMLDIREAIQPESRRRAIHQVCQERKWTDLAKKYSTPDKETVERLAGRQAAKQKLDQAIYNIEHGIETKPQPNPQSPEKKRQGLWDRFQCLLGKKKGA